MPTAVPGPGELAVLGTFVHPLLSIRDISEITVIAPDGHQVPLSIELSSIFFEFDRIVSLRFFFLIGESEASAEARPFVIQWGPGVKADNAKVNRIVLDPGRCPLYREFRWRETGSASSQSRSVATIEVIADSSAEYHFLWYLLPMALIFAILTIRKIRASHPAA